MKYKFSPGFTVEGTLDQILNVGKQVSEKVDITKIEGFSADDVPTGYHLSERSGLIELSSMNPFHLRNALIKRTKTYVAQLATQKTLTDVEFLEGFAKLAEDKEINSLYNELASR